MSKKSVKRKKIDVVIKKIKSFFAMLKTKFLDLYGNNVLWTCMPFILMELFVYIFRSSINYSHFLFLSPLLFNISWILFFSGVSTSLDKLLSRIFYSVFGILFMFMFLVNNVYYSTMSNFFDFSLVSAASEGAPYMIDALKNCNKLVYVSFVIIILFFVIGFRKLPNHKDNNFKKLLKIFVIFLIVHTLAFVSLGKANTDLTWSSWRNPKNIYNAFNDSNKSMKISGFYEYTIRNYYINFLKSEEDISQEDMEFLDSAFKEELSTKNKYTGKFKGKNLILIQLEGIDKWIINKNDTPNLYRLMNEGINFNNHYSFYTGGGSTFNSEFAVNTGFITPLSYNKNAYSFNKNEFPDTLAKIFKNMGYSVNAYHMNNGEYYSRSVNYKNWGYDNYYGLIDIEKYSDDTYMLDRELLLNEEFSNLLFSEDGPFVNYIITYSNHMPFTNTKFVCKMLYDLDNEGNEEVEFTLMSEEECARRQSKETDYMIELLINKLKEKNLYNNTAIVLFTDHYLYSVSDKTILDKYKNTSNNLINNTPFVIWSKGLKSTKINKVTSQLNILPTILNLYGVTYNKNRYIGSDALDTKYNGIVFFNDYSWYDGNVYVENGAVTNNKKINPNTLDEKNEYVNYLAKKNDLSLKYNYFKK